MCVCAYLFLCRQKTASERRISDWSSDGCSSDLVQRGLITDGMHRYVRHPNYLGEMMRYASFAMMVGHWLPWVWLAIIWASLVATNMVMKEASMSRYPGWAAYRQRTWWLLPGLL